MILKIKKTKFVIKHPNLGKGIYVKYDIPDGYKLPTHTLNDQIFFYKGKFKDSGMHLPKRKYDISILKDCKIIKDISKDVKRYLKLQ